MNTKKREALASPAKFGTEKPAAPKILPSAVRKQEVDRSMEEMELSMEEYKTMQTVKMAPLEQMVNEEEQESLAKEAARLVRSKVKEEHYARIAQAKVASEFLTENVGHHQATGANEDDGTTDEEDSESGGI